MFDVNSIIQAGGLLLIAIIIFAESGMFVGFFFPGDTLLLAGGVFAAQGKLNLATLILVVAVSAIAGDNVGYHIGKRYGRRLFKKKDGIVFRQEYVQRAEQFYEKHGDKTMLFAHFVPIVRTFAPPVAGVAKMNYKKYVVYDGIGIIAWAVIVTMIGYFFGTKIPNIDHYIMLAVGGVMVITLGPTFYHLIKALLENRSKKQKDD
ncbi:DedA family protein [bacterium]|jgi:membrane-associated protein|nr:DedA family protein [bacterium]